MRKLVMEKAAIKHNLSVIKGKADGAVIYGVLSGDGGGAGIVPLARILRDEGIGRFAVSEVAEVAALRKAGFVDEEILMLRSTTDRSELEELLAQAQDMSDLLQIEARLTDVRTELEQVTSQLRLYDNLVDYGTIELSVTEVQEYTPVEKETMWQRMGSGLKDSWQALGEFSENLLVFLVSALPWLIPISIIVALWIATGKKRRARRAERRAARKAKKTQQPEPPQEA